MMDESKPAAALLREWHEEITAELAEAREALPAARQRLRVEEQKAVHEADRKRELNALVQKGAGEGQIAGALQRRFGQCVAEMQRALVRPAQQEIATIVDRIADLQNSLEQIDRALRIAGPEASQAARDAPPRRPVAEAYDPIIMPGGDAA
jgi:hypothetical protein